MDPDNPYSAPDADPTAYPAAVRYPVLRWALGGAGCGGSLGLAFVLYEMFKPLPEGADDGAGPMFVAFLPFLALGLIAALALVGFVVGLLIGEILLVVPLFGRKRGPRRPMGG